MKVMELVKDNIDEYQDKIIHPYIFKDIYDNLKNSDYFSDFIAKNPNNSWFIFSDYCVDDQKKPNNVMTFTILSVKDETQLQLINTILGVIQKKDIKHTKGNYSQFIEFISNLPVFNISYILPKNRNFNQHFEMSELEYLNLRFHSLENFYTKLNSSPIVELDFKKCIKDVRFIIQSFKRKSLSLKLFRDIEIINCVLISISLIISQSKNNNKLIWVSDKDRYLTYEAANLSMPLVFTMVYASNFELTRNKCEFTFYVSHLDQQKSFDCSNRIPDMIAGVLADMTEKHVSHAKFLPIVRKYLTNQKQNHVAKIYFDKDKYGLNTIMYKK